MSQAAPLPDRDRLSILAALVLIAYSLVRIVVLPTASLQFSIFGLLFNLELNTRMVMLGLAAAMTTSGTDWVLQSHPSYKPGASRFDHWVVPALASLGVGAIIVRLPDGPALWVGLLLAALLLVAVLVAEFIVSDRQDARTPLAGLGLKSLAFLLIGGAFFSIHASGLRAIFAIPLIFLAASAVTWRLLRLSSLDHLLVPLAALVGTVTSQIGWALHYWPLPPVKASLILALLVYLGEGYLQDHLRAFPERWKAIELAVVGAVALTAIAVFT